MRGVKPAQVALAWLLHQPGLVAPVMGCTRPDQLNEAAAALDVALTAAEMAGLEEPYAARPVM